MIRLNDILDKAREFAPLSDFDTNLINKAYVYSAKVHAGQRRSSGEPYLSHPLEVSLILAELGLDPSTIATGLLHDTVEDTLATLNDIESVFGKEISFLVDGATKVGKLSNLNPSARRDENFKKLILATAKDVRVVFIKLADRLHNMRTLEFLDEDRRRKISKETLHIYAPVAHRLGIGWLASELEDLAFKFLNPREYRKIKQKLKKGRGKYEKKIDEAKTKLENFLLDEAGLRCEVFGRVKSFYSIYGKMKWQNLDLDELHDIIALRVITKSESDCYLVLGKIHVLWNPVPGRIKDYIALPKSNGYKSIHTTVMSPDGDQMEFQIRTLRMHEFAQNGMAAHWYYKHANDTRTAETEILRRFTRIGEIAEEEYSVFPAGFMESLKTELNPSVIYVYTPKAELVELPVGSTPVDFAYRIHTEIGDKCCEAVVNRKSVPLDNPLKTGDVVEIKVSKDSFPSEKWLTTVVTTEAKSKIRKSLSRIRREKSLEIGRAICERRFSSEGKNLKSILDSGQLKKPLLKLGFPDPEDFFRMVGFGRVSVTALQKLIDPASGIGAEKMGRIEKILDKVTDPESRKKIIAGNKTVIARFSNCCLPVPGEPIVGYATRGSGVVVHSETCYMSDEINSETIVPVEWRKGLRGKSSTGIYVLCNDSEEVLSSIVKTIGSLKADIVKNKTEKFEEGKKYSFLLKLRNIAHLEKIMDSLSVLEGVVLVERCGRVFE